MIKNSKSWLPFLFFCAVIFMGAAHRPLPEGKFKIYKVDDYGANGSDDKDDTSAIQATLDQAHAAGGGRVIFSEGGIYLLSATLWPQSHTILEGIGNSPALKARDGTDFSGGIMNFIGKNRITVRNLIFDGNVQNRKEAKRSLGGLFCQASQDCVMEKLTFKNLGKWTPPASGNMLTLDVEEKDLQDCARNIVKDCQFIDTYKKVQFGVRVYTDWKINQPDDAYKRFVRDNTFENLTFVEGFGWNCMELAGPATIRNKVFNSTARNHCAYGAFECDKGSKYNMYINCKVEHQVVKDVKEGDTFAFRAAGEPSEGFPTRIATGNSFINCVVEDIAPANASHNAYAFYVRNARQTIIENCTARNLIQYPTQGFVYHGNAEETTISNCKSYDCYRFFIQVADENLKNVIFSNNIHQGILGITMPYRGPKKEILIQGNDITVRDAKDYAGIEIDQAAFVTCVENIIKKTTPAKSGEKNAIRISGTGKIMIEKNTTQNF